MAPMMREWTPSSWGRKFTGSGEWTLQLSENRVDLTVNGQRYWTFIKGASPLRIHQGIFWTDLTLTPDQAAPVKVDGIPNRHGTDIAAAVQAVLAQQVLEAEQRAEAEHRTTRLARFQKALANIFVWRQAVMNVASRARAERRWITHEQTKAFIETKPQLALSAVELKDLLADKGIRASVGEGIADAELAIELWFADMVSEVVVVNEQHTVREPAENKDLLDHVESKPLTEEQARAVVCFDNRVQLVASAGSGKTSTMVAKAAYAIHRGFVAPERIVLLAFNASAAGELEERAKRSFKALGMSGISVAAKTFHSLGVHIIGQATGRKPRVPHWASEHGDGLRKLSELIDVLKDGSKTFRTQWDLFRLVFGRDTSGFGKTAKESEWDSAKRRGGIRTLRGELVKSIEESVIANWLFYNGVEYAYERNYEFDTATSDHSQYRPDFYYPTVKLYHEHYALNKKGEPPAEFRNYLDGVKWKRAEHQRHGTECIETTSYQLWTGDLFKHLTRELKNRGVRFDPNPDRPLPENGKAPMEHADLVELMRCFISHAKSNGLTQEALAHRLSKMPPHTFRYRHQLFLQLAAKVREAWEAALVASDGIDFEDMLIEAAEHVEQGRYRSPFDLVLADEFQDASWARARLCLALVREPGRHLFAVGDDWQSINRFAGADVSVMTGFQDWCGQGKVLRLEQTFRCPQRLCDASSHFVSKNPAQIRKHVRSETPEHGAVLQAFQVPRRDQIKDAIQAHLMNLHADLVNNTAPPGRDGKVSVFVLGRYKADEQFVPEHWRKKLGDRLDVKFTTMHRSKGAEADYVVLPGMVHRGFPNLRSEDPVLSLAMPGGDSFYLAEERRLFYVALTRARRSVAMFTVQGQTSVFLDELVDDRLVVITDTDGEPIRQRRCPVCKRGMLVERTGRYGPFFGCTNYPNCRHTS
jgi:DNA helicase-4